MSDRDARRQAIRERLLERLEAGPLIMGILNVTPDSFSDGGRFNTLAAALAQAGEMEREGADILDIGGESTRPGATPVSEADEIARVTPALETLFERSDTPLSIDTYKAATARAAARAGAVIINDVWGLTKDAGMANVVADTGSLAVITYNRGTTEADIDLPADMHAFFERIIAQAEAAGVPHRHMILDPGVGFSKTYEQNFQCLARLDILQSFNCPVLVGVSRKSFIGKLTGRDTGERLAGTLAVGLDSVRRGANILRVHDVGAHHDALKLTEAIGAAA